MIQPCPQGFVGDLLIVYAVALGIIVLAGRLGVPPIVALIGAGALSEPSGLRIIQTPEEVDQLAEIGIVLLLFTVGLEFPMRELRRIWRPVVLGGVLQVAGTAALAGAIAWAAGAPAFARNLPLIAVIELPTCWPPPWPPISSRQATGDGAHARGAEPPGDDRRVGARRPPRARTWTSPPPDLALAPNDVLYLLGEEADILLARARLSQGDA